MALDLIRLKARLAGQGYADPPGAGAAATYAALLACAAARRPDATIVALGAEAARLFPAFGMTTANRVAEFVAQTANETGGYTRFSENLNYSAQGLANTWPARFALDPRATAKVPNALARRLERRPEDIANARMRGRRRATRLLATAGNIAAAGCCRSPSGTIMRAPRGSPGSIWSAIPSLPPIR